MNSNLKSILKGSGIFILGAFVVMVATESLESYLRPTYRRVIGTTLKAEQEFQAGRAARENRPVEAAFHRWMVVNIESDDGFPVFRGTDKNIDDKALDFPLALLGFKWMWTPQSVRKGEKIVEGQDRAKLALALEAIGQRVEAEKQWKYAQRLQPGRTLEAVKESGQRLLQMENTDLHKKAEEAVLDRK